MLEEMRAVIHGEVQGVGFRQTTCTFAKQLALKGIVRNQPSGSVEIIAQGEKKRLEGLISKLKNMFDSISDIEIKYVKPERQFSDFSISL